jgi:hypothetical protein
MSLKYFIAPALIVSIAMSSTFKKEATQTAANKEPLNQSVTFRGFDHFMWAVRDFKSAPSFFRDTLGFNFTGTLNHMSTLDNFLIYFKDDTYLEPLTPVDTTSTFANAMKKWLTKHEGSWKIGFNAEPLLPLRERMMDMKWRAFPPSGGTFVRMNNRSDIAHEMWQGLSFTTPPGNYLFFWHFTKGWDTMKLKVPEIDPTKIINHRNTALGLKTAWVAVWEIHATARTYAQLGLPEASEMFEVPHLKSMARKITLPMGDLLFLQPMYFDSPVMDFLLSRGENLMGVSIEVENLETAKKVIENGYGTNFSVYDGIGGKSFLVPAEKARGVNLEFYQVKN